MFYNDVEFYFFLVKGGQGSGLGLWITKNIVELHHGTLTCHSDGLGKGCTMRLVLPVFLKTNDKVADETATAAYHQNSSPKNEDSQSKVRVFDGESFRSAGNNVVDQHCGIGKTILVVDDSTLCRKMVCRLLKSMSYECIEAKNGVDCLEKLTASQNEQQIIDLILLDFEMPIMDGPTACKNLREKGYTLPVIGLTGNVLKVDTDHFIECGATAMIAKPFSLDIFMEIIKQF